MRYLFRCTNPECADDPYTATNESDFETDDKAGTCPKCGISHKDAPQVVVPRVPVHYLLNDPDGPIVTRQGRRRVLCSPALKRLTGTHQATGMHVAVTCPDCKAHRVFKDHEEGDVDQNVPALLKKGVPI